MKSLLWVANTAMGVAIIVLVVLIVKEYTDKPKQLVTCKRGVLYWVEGGLTPVVQLQKGTNFFIGVKCNSKN